MNIALEAATELWRLLLADKFSLLEDWIKFLEVKFQYISLLNLVVMRFSQEKHGKAISRDTWNLVSLSFIRRSSHYQLLIIVT